MISLEAEVRAGKHRVVTYEVKEKVCEIIGDRRFLHPKNGAVARLFRDWKRKQGLDIN